MTRYLLLHIILHGNIHDTSYINVDEFHHRNALMEFQRQENYEILPKSLDKTYGDVLKSFHLPNFVIERVAIPRETERNLEIEARVTTFEQR